MVDEHRRLIVIGAGAGGLNAARRAVSRGIEVLLIERSRPGGECTWAGCIPSKALIRIAEAYHAARPFGVPAVDGATVMRRVRDITRTAHQAESVAVLEAEGIEYLHGTARFLDSRRIDVDGRVFTADDIIVTTGSRPTMPPIPGLADAGALTNETVFELEQLPTSLVVLGGGAIGVELSQAFSRLGVVVTLVEMAESILPREEPILASELAGVLERDGVSIRTATTATEVRRTPDGIRVTLRRSEEVSTITAQHVLVAVGRMPNVDHLSLDVAGVDHGRAGVPVDEHFQTSVSGIHAVGDIVGPFQFSHMAGMQARHVVDRIAGDVEADATAEYAWCTFTHPELARTGMTEAEVEGSGIRARVFTARMSAADRAVVDEATAGQITVVCDEEGLILGASILGERAAEMLGELQLLKTLRQPLHRLFDTIRPYPGYGEAFSALELRPSPAGGD